VENTVPAADTYIIRVHFVGGWDTWGTYPTREAALAEVARLRADGTASTDIIMSRV